MSEADGVAPVPGLLPAPASQCAATRRADCTFLSALQTRVFKPSSPHALAMVNAISVLSSQGSVQL